MMANLYSSLIEYFISKDKMVIMINLNFWNLWDDIVTNSGFKPSYIIDNKSVAVTFSSFIWLSDQLFPHRF